MSPAERAACEAALEALRAVLAADDNRSGTTAGGSEALRLKVVVAETGWSYKTAQRWAKRVGYKLGGVWYIERAKLRTVVS